MSGSIAPSPRDNEGNESEQTCVAGKCEPRLEVFAYPQRASLPVSFLSETWPEPFASRGERERRERAAFVRVIDDDEFGEPVSADTRCTL